MRRGREKKWGGEQSVDKGNCSSACWLRRERASTGPAQEVAEEQVVCVAILQTQEPGRWIPAQPSAVSVAPCKLTQVSLCRVLPNCISVNEFWWTLLDCMPSAQKEVWDAHWMRASRCHYRHHCPHHPPAATALRTSRVSGLQPLLGSPARECLQVGSSGPSGCGKEKNWMEAAWTVYIHASIIFPNHKGIT